MVLSQKLHEAFKGTVERITGPRTVSAFKGKGVLSVTEFLLAGDNLVSKCPTWSWESGEPSKRKPYLPAEKQFLITRNVPCLRRAASIEEEYEAAGGEVLLDNEDNDGWLATHGKPKETKVDEDENLPSMDNLDISKKSCIQSIPSYFGGEEEEDIPDMAEYEEAENLVESDPATLQSTYLVAHEPDDDNILRTRTYDVSITLSINMSYPNMTEQINSSPSPISNPLARLWRPAAQKNIRNQCSKLSSYRKQWVTTSSAARSHATSLVNVYLNHTYMPSVELGVLRDMPDIKTKACQKLLKQQELHRTKIVSYYKDMVAVVTQMVNSSRSMRCFLKGTSTPVVQFSSSSEDNNDTGECGDIPVFVFWSISSFEKLSEEVTQMYAAELSLKRLLISRLLSISSEASQAQKCWSDEFYPGEFDNLSVCNLYSKESCEPIPPSLRSLKSATPVDKCSNQPSREILQVYLTTWLAEACIDTHRVEEIFTIIGEEINVSL